MDQQTPIPNTNTTATPSQPTEPTPPPPQQSPSPALPQPQQPASQLPPSSTTPPAPTTTSNPNPNPNPSPALRPSASNPLNQPTTRPQIPHRQWQNPHPHSHFSHFSSIAASPSPSLPSSSVSSLSSSVPHQQRGGVAIGVPAPHPTPSPAHFSSSYVQQFSGVTRGAVNVPESVANASNSQVRHPMQGVQGMGMVGSVSSGSSIRTMGIPANHQQRPIQSSIRATTSSPSNQSPTAQNLHGHGFTRPVVTSAAQAPSTLQTVQSSSQPWLSAGSQGKPPLPSPSYRPQLSSPSLQQRSHIPQQHHSLPATLPQQHMSPAQSQQPLQSHQPPEHFGPQYPPPPRAPRSITQQLAHPSSANPRPSFATAQSNTVAQPMTQNPNSNSESEESGNRILSKRSIHELVSQIDPSEKLDPEVEDILGDIADEFVESITTFGCSLAKHRKSDTLEAKDILLHLERNWNMTLPGCSGDEIKAFRKPLTSDIHKERLAVIKKSVLASETGNIKNSGGQTVGNAKSNATRTPANQPNLKTREVT